jgi:RNA-directed DNA polymerase
MTKTMKQKTQRDRSEKLVNPKVDSHKSILESNHIEARNFFLKNESYCNFDLPSYFNFESILGIINKKIENTEASNLSVNGKVAKDFEDINYVMYHNKDSRFSWRPLELINPFLYVNLAHQITKKDNWSQIINRFKIFSANEKIKCSSIPVFPSESDKAKSYQILECWKEVELQSIQLGLEFDYCLETDISNCYGSIYTHSIAWSLHDKSNAKQKRQDSALIGNTIDWYIQGMNFGQTNGIPQGSTLMDFIAEMVLGYVDTELSKRLKEQLIEDYQILRYRDDYRIFANNPVVAENIAKELSKCLIEYGMKMNNTKTTAFSDIIHGVLKKDKVAELRSRIYNRNIYKNLYQISEFSALYPNSGSLSKLLTKFNYRLEKHIEKSTINEQYILPMISIIVNIAIRNSRTYPTVASILSQLLQLIPDDNIIKNVLGKIFRKFESVPNSSHMQIWLQRISIPYNYEHEFSDKLCLHVSDKANHVWDYPWLTNKLDNVLKGISVVDKNVVSGLEKVIKPKEVDVFNQY